MTVELECAVRAGAVTVAALVEQSVRSGHLDAIGIHAARRPVAIFIRRDGGTTAFDIDGTPIAVADLERRFPGQTAAFEDLAGAAMPGG